MPLWSFAASPHFHHQAHGLFICPLCFCSNSRVGRSDRASYKPSGHHCLAPHLSRQAQDVPEWKNNGGVSADQSSLLTSPHKVLQIHTHRSPWKSKQSCRSYAPLLSLKPAQQNQYHFRAHFSFITHSIVSIMLLRIKLYFKASMINIMCRSLV